MKDRLSFPIYVGLALFFAGYSLVQAVRQPIGASYQDIISAMGADALGLDVDPEKLPDISSLAQSHMQERPESFVVEHPYNSGQWRGGKAVIEYAHDFSYATINVYDKHGRRQRIYSVSARPPAPANPSESAAQAAGEDGVIKYPQRITVFRSEESEDSVGSVAMAPMG